MDDCRSPITGDSWGISEDWGKFRQLSLVPPAPSTKSPRWSDWHWSAGGRLVRVNLDNIQEEEECGDRCYLEQDLESLKEIRQEYLDSALKAKSKSRAKEMMRGVKDKDRQIAWVEGKLSELESDCDQSGGDRFQGSISPNKKPVDFTRGNSQESSQGISPNKKGRGKNNVPASGSLVPVVQKKRDKQGRIVEYPRVEGERVPRELAFDFPRQFNWQYCYSVRDEDGCWHTKKISVSPERVWSVRSAIASNKPVSDILSLIDS